MVPPQPRAARRVGAGRMGRQSLASLTSPCTWMGGREVSWGHGARTAPGPGAATLHLLGFDVEVFPQRDVPNGLASADGEHQRHHVRVKACERQETPTGMPQAAWTTEVASKWQGGPPRVTCRATKLPRWDGRDAQGNS